MALKPQPHYKCDPEKQLLSLTPHQHPQSPSHPPPNNRDWAFTLVKFISLLGFLISLLSWTLLLLSSARIITAVQYSEGGGVLDQGIVADKAEKLDLYSHVAVDMYSRGGW
ncbi:hypothetical protein VTL71DRAFT_9630 [Oculimacula yallundae]|uniref:Uncharacterized protein n=1 Tax=Oculimacula yallundae TaxID=86028 RepID=A0ABR4BRE7_9HELO